MCRALPASVESTLLVTRYVGLIKGLLSNWEARVSCVGRVKNTRPGLVTLIRLSLP